MKPTQTDERGHYEKGRWVPAIRRLRLMSGVVLKSVPENCTLHDDGRVTGPDGHILGLRNPYTGFVEIGAMCDIVALR